MKISPIFVLVVLIAGVNSLPAQPSREVEMLKTDLVGQCMGGREKCWNFQSIHQIKELVVNKKTEDGQKRVYTVTLQLQDPRAPGQYKADAVITYEKVKGEWKVRQVSCLSLTKVK